MLRTPGRKRDRVSFATIWSTYGLVVAGRAWRGCDIVRGVGASTGVVDPPPPPGGWVFFF